MYKLNHLEKLFFFRVGDFDPFYLLGKYSKYFFYYLSLYVIYTSNLIFSTYYTILFFTSYSKISLVIAA